MAVVLMAVGAVLSVVGVALYDPQAAVIAAGVLLMAAGVDLGRP